MYQPNSTDTFVTRCIGIKILVINIQCMSITDKSDAYLMYALANMVAVILGCEPGSNHLWYHLFDQQPIWNTYITGFMYDKTMGRGYHYDCGVELTYDGQFGRPTYEKHATRGTYDLHSLYHLMWLNFGSFCMALLTQPEAQENISGKLISDWQPVRHYCVAQLRKIWAHMITNIKLSQEELSFLFMASMKKFYKVIFNGGNSKKLIPLNFCGFCRNLMAVEVVKN